MDIDKIINEVEEMHPYKKAGDRDSYSEYAEGWSDACDILGEHIKQYLCEGNQANSENANCAIFDVIKRFLAHGITLDLEYNNLPYKIISYGAGRDEDYFVLEPISESEVYRYYKINVLESDLKSALANVL